MFIKLVPKVLRKLSPVLIVGRMTFVSCSFQNRLPTGQPDPQKSRYDFLPKRKKMLKYHSRELGDFSLHKYADTVPLKTEP